MDFGCLHVVSHDSLQIKGNPLFLRVSQNKSPETQRGYGAAGPRKFYPGPEPEGVWIRGGLPDSQTHKHSILRLAEHALRNAK